MKQIKHNNPQHFVFATKSHDLSFLFNFFTTKVKQNSKLIVLQSNNASVNFQIRNVE